MTEMLFFGVMHAMTELLFFGAMHAMAENNG
jgi:hypothetical protein